VLVCGCVMCMSFLCVCVCVVCVCLVCVCCVSVCVMCMSFVCVCVVCVVCVCGICVCCVCVLCCVCVWYVYVFCVCVCARARKYYIIANGKHIYSETLEIHNSEKLQKLQFSQKELLPSPRQFRGNFREATFGTRYRGSTRIPHAHCHTIYEVPHRAIFCSPLSLPPHRCHFPRHAIPAHVQRPADRHQYHSITLSVAK
jgi:hypothetical protein